MRSHAPAGAPPAPRSQTPLPPRLFLGGTVPEGATDSGWSTGHTGAVAGDQVSDYVLFEDLHAYQKAVSKSEAYDEEQSKGD